jgi:hypothetical protein
MSYASPQPPQKKQRTRRNAKTDEEKQARSEERAQRNRRAAQESRDRKKKQLEHLEKDNERLRQENDLLMSRMELLESRMKRLEQHGLGQEEVKQEVDEIVQAHYPAVVMSLGQQCQTISSPPPRQTQRLSQKLHSSTSILTRSLLSNQACRRMCSRLKQKQSQRLQTTLLPLTNLCSFLQHQWMISSLRISYLNVCTNSCATFDSLNTGSLEIGAEKGKSLLACESEFGGLFMVMVMSEIVSRFLSMEIYYMGLLGSWAGDSRKFIDGNVISLQQMEFIRAIVINIKLLKITALINSVLVHLIYQRRDKNQ